jgi:chromosome segregation ATPase
MEAKWRGDLMVHHQDSGKWLTDQWTASLQGFQDQLVSVIYTTAKPVPGKEMQGHLKTYEFYLSRLSDQLTVARNMWEKVKHQQLAYEPNTVRRFYAYVREIKEPRAAKIESKNKEKRYHAESHALDELREQNVELCKQKSELEEQYGTESYALIECREKNDELCKKITELEEQYKGKTDDFVKVREQKDELEEQYAAESYALTECREQNSKLCE